MVSSPNCHCRASAAARLSMPEICSFPCSRGEAMFRAPFVVLRGIIA